ncbi:erythroblast NAD(P)(+)--arginine ADP-ribosyltransferase-like [Xyrichtys novacula]|uniref:NAD(P)(+)--arginine ADP-ribosyltransferase n=1 Tax=Xyrichtys novacula TaxID=13765 RepID=A0AAV1EV58_XYRNO|nr:erythroblast NAD(P)(+)--arginine ADP-ribosyltransferase-like [Xyrichtys novacula]
MLIFLPLCLFFGLMLPADFMAIRFNFPQQKTDQNFPLNMVEDSVDDMYFGCSQKMTEKVKAVYFVEEMKSKAFADAWNKALECAKKKPMVEDRALTKDHMQAICVYTANDIYSTFNGAVRTQGGDYSAFKFHSLHYLLTSAIQILNSNNHCHTTYRRTSVKFTGQENQTIRFGSFASSSFYEGLTDFGNETCFKIKTCSGAFLKNYSTFDDEAEVLIPPYETFRITKNITGPRKYGELKDCKVVYELESAGSASRLNCKAVYP